MMSFAVLAMLLTLPLPLLFIIPGRARGTARLGDALLKKAAANDSQSTAAGDPAGIRTPDTLLKRQVLCLLSYWVMRLQASKFNLPPPILRGGAGGEVPGKGALCAEVAGMAGLEPTISESKSGVLPLHYIPPSTCAERPALPASRISGVGDGARTHDTRNHNPVLIPTELHPPLFALLARQEGFEPPAYCLEGSCSILLSYWRMWPEQQYRRNAPASLDIVTSAARFVNIFGNFSLGAQRRESALCKSAIYRRCCERR